MLHRSSSGRRSAEDGISEVVGFVIILAVVVAGMSLYLTYAVPVQGREEEIKVMDGVRAWFVDYKAGTDQLWLNSPLMTEGDPDGMFFKSTGGQTKLRKVIDPGTAREKGFIGRYLPLLAPIPCSGQVSVRTDDRFTITGKMADAPDTTINIYDDEHAPALVYTSNNYYWFQQEYSYQLGGIFLRQWDKEGEKVTLVAAPPLSIYRFPGAEDTQTAVELVAVRLDAVASGIGATSPIRVETALEADPAAPDDEETWPMGFSEVTMTFHATSAEAAQAWKDTFIGAAARNGLEDQCEIPEMADEKDASIIIDGPPSDPAVPAKNDVMLDLLVADYSVSLGNVPTMIE